MTSDELRTAFLKFFESKGHKIIPSSSLIPQGDPTLLLTTAGMVQIKSYFLGEAVPPNPRLASCQKCFRTTDIESVGDTTHLTFFEMLGNFSVGDYFKQEAIAWAWEFVTRHLGLSPEGLWITIFLDDEKAFHYWRQLGIPEERILRFGEEDNFWGPAGDSGPCGPCSEIFYDFGEEIGCGKPSCGPNCCTRFSEIWNLVFTQYNQDKDGKRTPLPKPNIDTGMGLERTAAAVQGKTSVYETDLFVPLLECIAKLAGKRYGADEAIDNAMRVVAEHSRGITFLIGDGVMPSNEGRGYVLRRLLRRAALFGRKLGLGKPFLAETARTTIEQMGHVYPELKQRQDFIIKVIELEEAKFSQTLDEGLQNLEGEVMPLKEFYRLRLTRWLAQIIGEIDQFGPSAGLQAVASNFIPLIEQCDRMPPEYFQRTSHGFLGAIVTSALGIAKDKLVAEIRNLVNSPDSTQSGLKGLIASSMNAMIESQSRISGEEAFILYDTYGFPVELTKEIAAGRGFSVDVEGFEREMEKQRERARAERAFKIEAWVKITPNGLDALLFPELNIPATKFVGYHNLKYSAKILSLSANNELVGTISKGQEVTVILEATPFYAEMGGQVGDTGEIRSPKGHFSVTNTIRVPPDIIIHQGRVTEGSLTVGDEVEAEVDRERRLDIARNHTATHLLQSALRQVLGKHIQQRGSLVAPERFRFDFSHLVALTRDEIDQVQQIVNERIRQNLAVYAEDEPYQQAVEEGAIAIFGEKYGDIVRVLKIGRPPISAELCGGTHLTATGEVGFFYIISESSIGAGLRRIEAVTGRGAERYIAQRLSDLEKIAKQLDAEPDEVVDKVQSLSLELKNERKKVQSLERKLAKKNAQAIEKKAVEVGGIKVLAERVDATGIDNLREMSDLLRDKLGSGVVVLGTILESGTAFVANVSPDLVKKGYHAGEIVKRVSKIAGGSGGGRANIAQGGGKNKNKIDEALEEAVKYVEEKHSS